MRCALDGEHGHPRCRLLFGEIIGEHRVKFVFVDEAFVAKIARPGTLQACSWQVLFYGNIKGEKLALALSTWLLVSCFFMSGGFSQNTTSCMQVHGVHMYTACW